MFNKEINLSTTKLGEVYVLLQMDCELKCKVCPYWGTKGACNDRKFKEKYVGAGQINVQRLKDFIDEVSKYSPKTITLSGGEPLLYPAWVEVAKYIKRKGIKVSLSTNGLHLGKYLREVVDCVDGIQLSLGGTKEILSKTRCADYGFDLVVDNLRKISEYKKKKNLQTPYVKIIYVISHISYNYIQEFYNYFKMKGIIVNKFYFQHLMYIDKESLDKQKTFLDLEGFNASFWHGFLYEPLKMDFNEFFKQINYLKQFKDVSFSPNLNDEEVRLYYDPSKKCQVKREITCFAPWSQVDLYPNGDIMVCPDYVVGNIYNHSFDEIWDGEKIRKLRKYLIENKKFPGCQSCFYYYVTDEDP